MYVKSHACIQFAQLPENRAQHCASLSAWPVLYGIVDSVRRPELSEYYTLCSPCAVIGDCVPMPRFLNGYGRGHNYGQPQYM